MPTARQQHLLDLAAILADPHGPAVTADLQTLAADGTAVTRMIRGLFDDPFVNAGLGEYEADTSSPRFGCLAVDVLGVVRGDCLVIDGLTYAIMAAPQGDGTGWANLRLEPEA